MKKHILRFSFCIALALGFSQAASAQFCDSIANRCATHIKVPFVSDGQSYRAFVNSGEEAEFQTTLYAGTTYRIAACAGRGDGDLNFRVSASQKDGQPKVIFDSSTQGSPAWWDFKVNSTFDAIINASINPKSSAASGCAVLLLGFKQ